MFVIRARLAPEAGGAAADDLVSDSFAHTAALDGLVVAEETGKLVENAPRLAYVHQRESNSVRFTATELAEIRHA